MNLLGFLVTVVCAYYLFTLPRGWAPLPMLIAATYMTAGQALDVAGLNFTVIRLMALVGLIRVAVKRERIAGGFQTMDRLVAAWAVWLVCSAVFHKNVGSTLVFRAGFMFDNMIIYFLFRIFMRDLDEFLQLTRIILYVLAPLAVLMVVEKIQGYNWFSLLGGLPSEVVVRNGKVRAQGPFAHPILAGTVGAACLPLAALFWRRNRKLALLGGLAAGAMVFASASSGPIMTVLIIFFGLALWKTRERMRAIRWTAVVLVLVLSVVMQAPIYYLLAKIDLTGSSTGWHRAALIEAALNHLSEWWLVGTDYTRHWMPTGVPWSPDHTDITNYYLQMGVMGGLPLMLLFMGVVVAGFTSVGFAMRRNQQAPSERRFLMWTLGAVLFGHATTFLSIPYFDQTVVYYHFLLAAIGSLYMARPVTVTASAPDISKPASAHEPNLCHHC